LDEHLDKHAEYLTTKQLAAFFGITPERVQQLAKQGVIEAADTKRKKGKGYLFEPNIAAKSYISYLQNIVSQRKNEDEDLDEAVLRKAIADADWKEKQAEKSALEVAKMRNALHDAETVEGYFGAFVSFGRAQIEMIPKHAARRTLEAAGIVPNKEQELAAIRILTQEIDGVLTTFSEFKYDPDELSSAVIDLAEQEDDELG
jgi:phage terminase Nu1 subunit (DNA packaging protein)